MIFESMRVVMSLVIVAVIDVWSDTCTLEHILPSVTETDVEEIQAQE